ncbi:MAG: hypothetical protein DSZ05_02570 [Sulfurospirillum sp.]|nr:MAG: hypothetical protein DSZ05_02570 [Sulfurospirillum sp.]
MLLLSGCGGGSFSRDEPSSHTSENPFTFDRISIAGSSITHGNIENTENDGEGYLGELSYVGEVEKYFRENVADTIGPDELSQNNDVIETPMSYQGKLKVYSAGKSLTGTLNASDEIAIAFGGANVDTKIEMDVDGQTFRFTIPAGNYLPVKKVFDDTNTHFYKAFRENNPRAIKVWKLDKDQAHTFTLKVLSGELHLNFITNHMYYFQNAGVGGFEAANFLEKRPHSTVNDIIAFDPDLFIFESGTNDAKTWAREIGYRVSRESSTNSWIIENPVHFSSNGKTLRLGRSVTVAKGDVVVMGDYKGDIEDMAVGIVAKDSTGNKVTLSKIVTYSGQAVHEINTVPQTIANQCRIKSIKQWEDRVKRVVDRVKNGVGHSVTVGIATSGVPNYWNPKTHNEYLTKARRLLGYREKGKVLAKENGWFFADFFQKTLQIEPGVDEDHKWSFGDNTHPNQNGREAFGQAIIEAISPYLN